MQEIEDLKAQIVHVTREAHMQAFKMVGVPVRDSRPDP
jgi:hypothetical protein